MPKRKSKSRKSGSNRNKKVVFSGKKSSLDKSLGR